jgi:hypothetical protein
MTTRTTCEPTTQLGEWPLTFDDKNRSEVDLVIVQVKQELRNLFVKSDEQIKKAGNVLKKVVKKEEGICEEIKIALKEEIAEGVISTRTIELHCPPEWKRKTKPKNEKISFSKQAEEKPQQQISTMQGGKSVIINETSSNTESPDGVNQPHDEGIGIDGNNEAQLTIGKSVSYNEPKDNTVSAGDSASSDVVQKLQPHQVYSQNDQKEKAMPANQITEDRDHKIKQLQKELYERTQELVDKISQNAKLSDELRHFKELRTLQKDDASNDVVQKLLSHSSDRQIDCLEAQTLKQTSMRTAGVEFEFTIPKEKYGIVRGAMDNSKASIFVKFDLNKNFLGADPDVVFDISGANHQDGNVQQIQSDDVAFAETKEMMIARG